MRLLMVLFYNWRSKVKSPCNRSHGIDPESCNFTDTLSPSQTKKQTNKQTRKKIKQVSKPLNKQTNNLTMKQTNKQTFNQAIKQKNKGKTLIDQPAGL